MDSASKQPISHAKVWVEIVAPPEHRNGYTDSNGVFRFSRRLAANRTKATVRVESEGYRTVQNVSLLIDRRLIELTKEK
jgi:hypothetical protein